jgi:spermidine synthase
MEATHVRNFFGTMVASHDHLTGMSQLFHGTTIHGEQDLSSLAARRQPRLYFSVSSGIGQLFAMLQEAPPHTVGVVGLGAGTLACYSKPGQHWIYYEINPAVLRIARDERYFTYLKDAEDRGVKLDIVLGDARLTIQDSPVTHDLLIVDAFNSDVIPVHLLTREALQIYLSKLTPHGLLAFHISNRFVDLTPVLADLARSLKLVSLFFTDKNSRSWWMVLARQQDDVVSLLRSYPRWQRFSGRDRSRVWTDDFSNLYSVFWPAGVVGVPQASQAKHD